MIKEKVKKVSKSVRSYRVWHRYFGISISLLVFISAVTGIFLGWKKNFDILQPPTLKGISVNMNDWKSAEELALSALASVDSLGLRQENIDRIEYRPTKGIAKVIFDTGSWEVQVDATTSAVLSLAKRNSDWIEKIHDGSIISEFFKVASMNVLGIGLLVLIFSGLWLWFGPKKIRKLKR
jgi:uncharacterized iron-regulated membrane protein